MGGRTPCPVHGKECVGHCEGRTKFELRGRNAVLRVRQEALREFYDLYAEDYDWSELSHRWQRAAGYVPPGYEAVESGKAIPGLGQKRYFWRKKQDG